MLAKRKSHAFGKDVYLIGINDDGELVWLEEARWDCGWYWGFGYMKTYTNNYNPSVSRNITSHSHWSGFVGQMKEYSLEKKCFQDTRCAYHINESSLLKETVLTDKESWELSDLMRRFYVLKEVAEILHGGTAHLTTSGEHKTKNDEFRKWINEVELPKIFEEVYKILSPEDGGE
jgi:hypothetical protein